jgi:membrane-associated phospholipid phosphatase
MTVRLRSLHARMLPHGWRDVLRQLALLGLTYSTYQLVRGAVDGRPGPAFQHARELISVERTLHFFVEPSIQAWASGSHFVMAVSSWIYINAQISISLGALVFLYVFHNRSFYFVRNMLIVAMAIALLGYIVFPTAPPRFLPEWGFTDTVSDITGVRATSAGVDTFFNPYAAVPSMHVAFALMIGWPLARLVRWRIARWFWAVYPLLITFVIVATANHFIFDAVLGALTAGIAASVADRLARRRPEAWRFEPQPAVAAQTT